MAVEESVKACRQSATSGLLLVGAGMVHLGLLALAASAVWTVSPLSPLGLWEHFVLGLVGVVLVGAAIVGRARFAASITGKLLCGLGAGICLRLAVDPTLEDLPAISKALPMWVLNAYPGLPTIGWLLAGIGALVWWMGGGRVGEVGVYRGVAMWVALLVIAAAVVTGTALQMAGYEVPTYDNALLCWRTIETVVTLMVAMSVSGGHALGLWPAVTVGLGILGHVSRALMTEALG